METRIVGIPEKDLKKIPECKREIISQCAELIGPELVKELLQRLGNPEKFLESIIDTNNPRELLGGVVTQGRVDPKWKRIVNSVPPELVFSAIKLDPSLWGDCGLRVLKNLSSLDRRMFEELTEIIESQARISRSVFKIWASREPTVDRVLSLTDYLQRSPDLVFLEHILPRTSSEIPLDEVLGLDVKTDPLILSALSALPKDRGEKQKSFRTIEEVVGFLELARPIKFQSEEAKDWCMEVLKSALHAYGKLPSRRSLEELSESLEIIFANDPAMIIGESPKKFCSRLHQSVIRGLRLVALKAKRSRNIKKEFPGFARIVEETLNPFLTGIKWRRRPSSSEKNRAIELYVSALGQEPRYLGIAGPLAINALLKDKPITDITSSQFQKVFRKYAELFRRLNIDERGFTWHDSLAPLLEDNNNWVAKSVALREILSFYSPSAAFAERAIDLASRWPKIAGVEPIIRTYRGKSLDVLEAILKAKEPDRRRIVELVSELKPERPVVFIKTALRLKPGIIHLSWGLDRPRDSLDRLIEASKKIAPEEAEKLGKIVAPLHPEFFVEAFNRLGAGEFEQIFKSFKVIVSEEELLAKAIDGAKSENLDIFLPWFLSQSHKIRREVVHDFIGGIISPRWMAQRMLASPFGLLGEPPKELIFGPPKDLKSSYVLWTGSGEGGAQFLQSVVPYFWAEIRKDYGVIREELIDRIARARRREGDVVNALERIAAKGRRLEDQNKIHLIEATLNLSKVWGGVTDYEIAQMSANELENLLNDAGLEETSRFKSKILEAAKSRYARRISREIKYFDDILNQPEEVVPQQAVEVKIEEEDLHRKLERQYATPAEGQEYNGIRLKRLREKARDIVADEQDIESLVSNLCKQVGPRNSLYEFKEELRKLVERLPQRDELKNRLFLDPPEIRIDIDESREHIIEVSWKVALSDYEMIEEILDIGAESYNLIRSTLAARVVGIYPAVKYATENPILMREAIERVSEALEEDLGMDIQDKPSYKLTKARYELKLRDIDGEFSPLLSSRKESDRCAALTAVTDSGEKIVALLVLRGDVVVGITPSASLLYSGKIPLAMDREVEDKLAFLRAQIFYDL